MKKCTLSFVEDTYSFDDDNIQSPFCYVSQNIFQYLKDQETSTNISSPLCHLFFPNFISYDLSPKLYYYKLNAQLSDNHVEVISHNPGSMTLKVCYISSVNNAPVVLNQININVNSILFTELLKLENQQEQLEFIRQKGQLYDGKIIHENSFICNQWCKITKCYPYHQGIFNINNTKIVLLNGLHENVQLNQFVTSDKEYNIKPLPVKIQKQWLYTKDSEHHDTREDDSILAFADESVFLKLQISNGSLVELFFGHNSNIDNNYSKICKLIILPKPNELITELDSNTIFVPPHIFIHSIKTNNNSISVKPLKYLHNLRGNFTKASSIKLSRVASILNSQKLYQSLIQKELTDYFLEKSRLLSIGDYIPVLFDSRKCLFKYFPTKKLFSGGVEGGEEEEEEEKEEEEKCRDSLVWFQVIESSVSNNTIGDKFFLVDQYSEIVIENYVSYVSIPRSICNYIEYYKLPKAIKLSDDIFSEYSNLKKILGTKLNTKILIYSSTNSVGKYTTILTSCLDLGLNILDIDCLELGQGQPTNKIIGMIKAKIDPVLNYCHKGSSVLVFKHLECIIRDDAHDETAKKFNISFLKLLSDYSKMATIILTTNKLESMAPIRSSINFEIELGVPNEKQRMEIFKFYLKNLELDYSKIATQSAGLTPIDIKAIATRSFSMETDSTTLDLVLKNINKARDEFSESIGAPKIPNVTWEDVGGLDMVKGEIMDTIDMPLRYPELFGSGMKRRSGILFYGPPGTGKTLLAKAIATNFSLNFFSVKGPELLNMYIGESEANVRRVFQKARDAKPCVIFFDELDSVAPKRGNQGDSGGVMDRIVSQLLAELDGANGDGGGVFVVGATNRPDLLDEALLRPGRFDKLLYLGISDTNEKQCNIIKALTRKFAISEDTDLLEVAANCPFTYTGADFYALCSDAMLNAMTRVAKDIDLKLDKYNKEENDNVKKPVSLKFWFDNVANDYDIKVVVTMEDFIKAQKNLKPSVSAEELEHYLKIRANFEN
ncbi:related to Peroxisomal biogenesis factor 6 [Saccharomycodes ludwigii]|uniref:Peroxisomal ATPase PEX6 n=1 Tax=Saccharomycodes ludwigii TaxID=36035 RepID=A0A376B271_9ASCO|nr:hypothetical protein SCDLUD_004987 [Saccharomycodes ludwigii]KAH3898665.1 hypothetical protein SCDLUD_004987 [Saccharomycodes ludwigii]SSD58751.1 related to Peroxisomal biogenesis factor 6 [Saccharomycodes ludwigii]